MRLLYIYIVRSVLQIASVQPRNCSHYACVLLTRQILHCMACVSIQTTSLSHIRAQSLLTDCRPPTSDWSSLCNTV